MKNLYRKIGKEWIFLMVFILFVVQVKAQIAGVSGSKLTAVDAMLVPQKTMEVEPSYIYIFSRKAFDSNGKLYSVFPDNDTAVILKDFFFRFTYGVGKRLEIGTFVNGSLNSISFGAKYRFIQHKKFLAVALLGMNFSDRSNFGIRRVGFFGKFIGINTGVALTQNFSPVFSMDIAAQYQNSFCYDGFLSDNYFLDTDVGYYFFHHTLQVIGGLSFQYHNLKKEEQNSFLLSLHPGVTIETGKSFIIVFYIPVDIVGKNVNRFTGFSFAFTLAMK